MEWQAPIEFHFSSKGVAVNGATKSAAELLAFVERLKSLLPLLPVDNPTPPHTP